MPDDYRIRQVLESVEDDPSRSLLELAHLVSLSSSRLGHLFRLQVEINLSSFCQECTSEKKAKLLQETELSIKEIAAKVGYHHTASFDRGFEKKFRTTPADYRRKRLS